jgi:hypothetical protein
VDIVLGVSMTPTTVRMVLVEGENGDGTTVDHEVFEAESSPPERVVAAIAGTRESAADGGHRLVTTGVAWRDHRHAAELRRALTTHGIDDVVLVSESHAAAALAQAAGAAVGYARTALMFLDRDTVTLSVVETADGAVVKVQSRDLQTGDAVAQLGAMLADLEDLDAPPQGVFVVGSGVSLTAIKSRLESATSLPVRTPAEPGLALARGAALAAASMPTFDASTAGLAGLPDGGPTAGSPIGLAYSEVGFDDEQALPDLDAVETDRAGGQPERRPFLLVGSAVTGIFVVGMTALAVSLAVSIRPTVDQLPNPGESMTAPAETAEPAAVVPSTPPVETIQAPKPVAQERPQTPPRTVYVAPPAANIDPPAAPVPAVQVPPPAAPVPVAVPARAAPAPVSVPSPAAPAPIVRAPAVAPPLAVPTLPAPVVVLPQPRLPIIQMPWDFYPQAPARQVPPQHRPHQAPLPQVPITQVPRQVPLPQVPLPRVPKTQVPQQVPLPQVPLPQVPQRVPVQQVPGSESPSTRSGSGMPGLSGRDGSSSDESGSGAHKSGSQGGGDSLWPWPTFDGGH